MFVNRNAVPGDDETIPGATVQLSGIAPDPPGVGQADPGAGAGGAATAVGPQVDPGSSKKVPVAIWIALGLGVAWWGYRTFWKD